MATVVFQAESLSLTVIILGLKPMFMYIFNIKHGTLLLIMAAAASLRVATGSLLVVLRLKNMSSKPAGGVAWEHPRDYLVSYKMILGNIRSGSSNL